MSEESEQQINLSDLEPVKSDSGLDLNKFHKTEATIVSADVMKVNSAHSNTGEQWVLKVSSEVLESMTKDDGTKVDFRASELFNLMQDSEGNLKGYPSSEESNLQKFMKDIEANQPSEIIGKKATVKSYQKDVGGQEKTFLKFMY